MEKCVDNCKVSIITISFNAGNTISETIESVLNQKDETVEYIIIDGGSTDGTLDIINNYGDKIDKLISEPDEGISDAFNKGINNSSGDLICIVNSDDLLYKDSIKTAKNIYKSNPEADIIYGDIKVFNKLIDDGYTVNADTDLRKLKYAFLLPHPGMFISRNAYKKYGLYDIEMKNAMDYELVSRMYFAGAKLVCANRVMAAFREGGTSQAALGRTLKEHRSIAKRNGAGFFEREIYLERVKIRRKTAPLLKRIGIENTLQRAVKRKNNEGIL